MSNIIFDHNTEIRNKLQGGGGTIKKKKKKRPMRINNMLLNTQWITEENKEEI